jgi:hypothetical protein
MPETTRPPGEGKRVSLSAQNAPEEFQALFRLRDSLHEADSYDRIFEAVCNALRAVLGIERVSIQVFDKQGHTKFRSAVGLSPSTNSSSSRNGGRSSIPRGPRPSSPPIS